MFKTSKFLYNLLKMLLLIYTVYFLLFIICHLVIPDIGGITIRSSANLKDPEIKEIKIHSSNPKSKYYIFIYEEEEKNRWIYFVNQSYNKYRQNIADQFLPKKNMKYILFEGNKEITDFTFQIKPKYPISYVARKKSSFHVIYLFPYKIYPFPPFYYCKHMVFYIDALK